VIRLRETPAAGGRVFNIGSDEPISIRRLAEEIIQRIDPSIPISYLPYSRAYGDDFEDVRRRVPDVTRLTETIGCKPSMPLGHILEDVISWKRGERVRSGRPGAAAT
jgi:UDP-glucose 4-epimerase